jgi:hypothetical protein
MKEFFHGWRRKASVVTLVMALAVTSAWIRSLQIQDAFAFHFGTTSHDVLSQRGMIHWLRSFDLESEYYFEGWYTYAFEVGDELAGPNRMNLGSNEDWHSIPYVFLALPLTVVTVYLMLWRRQKRTPVPLAELDSTTPQSGI